MRKRKNRARSYAAVQSVASPSESEGLKKPRSILLLWFLRHVMGVDDLEAYEFVCDGDLDQGIDGLLVENAPEPGLPDTLVLFQSKYPQGPRAVGVNDLKSFVGTGVSFKTPAGLESFLDQPTEPELRSLIDRYDLEKRTAAKELALKLIFVTAGYLNPRAKKYVREVNSSEIAGFLRAYDLDELAPLVEAFRGPQTVDAIVSLECSAAQRFAASSSTGKVVVASIKAADIVSWPGIDDRSLFDLNVRRQLRRNRVRQALERGIQRSNDHRNFLAFHNGLTVICENIDDCSWRLRRSSV